jgi:hypothetical protein
MVDMISWRRRRMRDFPRCWSLAEQSKTNRTRPQFGADGDPSTDTRRGVVLGGR